MLPHSLSRFLTPAVFLSLWLAVTPAWAGSMLLLGAGGSGGGFTPGCSQSSTFLARTSGLSTTERNAYDTMICGMVTDGVFAKLDALYIFATNTTTTANLNLVSTSFTGTVSGTLTFTADQGYTGNGSTGFFDTGLVLTAASQFSLNNASFGIYDRSNSNAASSIEWGVTDGTNLTRLAVFNSGFTGPLLSINSSGNVTANTTVRENGLWFADMVGGNPMILYRNGNTGTPIISSSAAAVVAVPITFHVFIFAQNASGTANSFSSDQLSAAWVGGAFSTTDVANFSSRLNTFMTALGINVY